jgi:hypothetical protein
MGQVCRICNSGSRSTIDEMMNTGSSLRKIHEQFPAYSMSSIWAHSKKHRLGSVSLSVERTRRDGSEVVLRDIASIRRKAAKLYRFGVAKGDVQAQNFGLNHLRGVADLQLRASAVIRTVQSASNDETDYASVVASLPGGLEALKALVKERENESIEAADIESGAPPGQGAQETASEECDDSDGRHELGSDGEDSPG